MLFESTSNDSAARNRWTDALGRRVQCVERPPPLLCSHAFTIAVRDWERIFTSDRLTPPYCWPANHRCCAAPVAQYSANGCRTSWSPHRCGQAASTQC